MAFTPAKRTRGGRRKKRSALMKLSRRPGIRATRLVEEHNVDVGISSVISTTSLLTLLNGVALGTSDYQRVGRRIEMGHLEMNLTITTSATTTAGQDFFRMIVFYDRQTNGAAPVYGDVMHSVDNAGAVTVTPLSQPNNDNKYRFTILWSELVYLPEPSAGGANNLSEGVSKYHWVKKIPLKGRIVQYLSDAAGVADIATGSLYFAVLSGQIASGNSDYTMTGKSRLRFTDV